MAKRDAPVSVKLKSKILGAFEKSFKNDLYTSSVGI
jgi:hypothetical protein